jgi:hypothetical protein
VCIALLKMSQFDENKINKEMDDFLNFYNESDGDLEFDSEGSSNKSESLNDMSDIEMNDDIIGTTKRVRLESWKWVSEPNKVEKFNFTSGEALDLEIINSLGEFPSENDIFKIFTDVQFWENIAQQTNIHS